MKPHLQLGHWLAGMAGLVLVASVFLSATHLPSETICFMKRWTGFDCPGCGLTRAFVAISHGQFNDALDFHLLSPFWYAGCFLAALLPLTDLRRPGTSTAFYRSTFFRYAFPTLLILTLLYGWTRLGLQIYKHASNPAPYSASKEYIR